MKTKVFALMWENTELGNGGCGLYGVYATMLKVEEALTKYWQSNYGDDVSVPSKWEYNNIRQPRKQFVVNLGNEFWVEELEIEFPDPTNFNKLEADENSAPRPTPSKYYVLSVTTIYPNTLSQFKYTDANTMIIEGDGKLTERVLKEYTQKIADIHNADYIHVIIKSIIKLEG